MLSKLQTAVVDRKVLSFEYDGKPRLVEPHAVGRNKVGAPVLRGFQVGGESASNRTRWKLFTVEKMVDVMIVDITSYAPRSGYKAGDTAMSEILAQLPDPVAEAA